MSDALVFGFFVSVLVAVELVDIWLRAREEQVERWRSDD